MRSHRCSVPLVSFPLSFFFSVSPAAAAYGPLALLVSLRPQAVRYGMTSEPIVIDVRAEGPSSIPIPKDLNSDSSVPKDRQRQVANNQKAERVFGTPVPASYIKHGIVTRGAMATDGMEGKTICLNSPISRCPTSFSSWSVRLPSAKHTTPSTAVPTTTTESNQSTTNSTLTSVAPLNFKNRTQRRSLSMAKIETEMTDYKRDSAPFLSDLNNQGDATGEPCITRRQSLPETRSSVVSVPGEDVPKRLPRPLPPVPFSRPPSPTSSNSSHTSHNGPRPLPNPPFRVPRVPVPSVTPSMFGAVKVEAEESPPTESPEEEEDEDEVKEPAPKRMTPHLRVSVDTKHRSDLFSPLSSLSIITELPHTLRIPQNAPSPRNSEARKRHRDRIHASPYKIARNPKRFSTTSLSSQVSVPPSPSPAEIRRRNREKMAKLIRLLGESPPSHLVFAEKESERTSVESEEDTIEEESVESTSSLLHPFVPYQRSIGLGLGDSSSSVFGMKKAFSDPDAGHGPGSLTRSPYAFGPQPHKPISFLRSRSKRGRANDNAPRYVVSLFDTAESKTSERLTFKLHTQTPKPGPANSYLRSVYKQDLKPSDVKIPSLPRKIPGIDLPKPTHTWVRDSRQNRWEVDDYENVVASLRKL